MTTQQTALITGVSSGIGLAIAKDLLDQGYQVFGSVRKREDAGSLLSYGDNFCPLVFDVTDTDGLTRAASELEIRLNGRGLNVLINNAGIGLSGPLLYQPMADIRRSFEVNVIAVLSVTRAVLPYLGAREDFPHPPGRIINIGSISGAVTVPFVATYSATKHALEALAQGLRRELSPFGIEVSTIEPGMIKTNLQRSDKANYSEGQYADTVYRDSWPQFVRATDALVATGKSTEIVTQCVNKIIQAKKPRPRNPLDASWYLGRVLPDRFFDKIIFNALKIGKYMRYKN